MFSKISDKLKSRAQKIKMICFDVDGVLTDGSLYIAEEGEFVKRFSSLDGYGMKLALKFGLKLAIISARHSVQVRTRFGDLGLSEIYIGEEDKLGRMEKLMEKYSLSFDECAYIGDDIIDVPVLEKVGLAACPKDPHYSVLKHIHYITEKAGGYGAAREFTDLILFCQGKIPA
jgi:3-deoxy-D-manno-octulosonate 8-phosphate phosphatase (KDO 8-P phosphatase)